MKTRIRCDLIFDPKDTATKKIILDILGKVKPKLRSIGDTEHSSITVEDCYHDEGLPCKIIEKWENVVHEVV